ncbi:hypothetical protein D9M71_837430 [compost metagenome]
MGVVNQLPGQLRVKASLAIRVCLSVRKGRAEYFLLMLARFQCAYQVLDVAFVHALWNDRGIQRRQFEGESVQVF